MLENQPQLSMFPFYGIISGNPEPFACSACESQNRFHLLLCQMQMNRTVRHAEGLNEFKVWNETLFWVHLFIPVQHFSMGMIGSWELYYHVCMIFCFILMLLAWTVLLLHVQGSTGTTGAPGKPGPQGKRVMIGININIK